MKTNVIKLLSVVIGLLFNYILNAQTYEWAQTFGGTGGDLGFSTTVDGNGNVYTTGYFSGTVDFDPSSGVDNHTSNGDDDIFIQKMDASGNFQWVETFGGNVSDRGVFIAVDGNGNVYTTGIFSGTVDFDPSSGVNNHTSNGTYDIFVQKLDTSGNFLWTKTFGGTVNDFGQSITVDGNGNVYTTGIFGGTVDFDPSSGVDNHTSNAYDIFVQKLDASGNFQWAKTFGGNNADVVEAITLDRNGNIYITGDFEGTVDFDPSSGVDNHTSDGDDDIFIQKLDTSGNFQWAKTFGGTGGDRAYSITVDGNENIYTTGTFFGTVDFDPSLGVDNHTSNGDHDVFIQKLDASGNFQWAQTFGGNYLDEGFSIAIDVNGDVYTTGIFEGTVNFNPSSGVDNRASNGDHDVFIQKLDASGNFQWAQTFGGAVSDIVYSITADANANVYLTGEFSGTVDFDPSTGVDNHTSNGSYDIFIQKIRTTTVNTIETIFEDMLQVYPNPTFGNFAVDLGTIYESVEVSITDITGKLIDSGSFNQLQLLQMNIVEPAGVYIISIQADDKKAVIQLLKE